MEKESESFLRARRKRVLSELLIKGREMAAKLQTLLRHPGPAPGDCGGSLSVRSKLSFEIFRSFSDAISQLDNCRVPPPPPPPPQRGILFHDSDGQKCWSNESAQRRVEENETPPPGRTGRGGYKRRKNSGETWTNVCKTMEDGYAWRKYGQKQIHNSLHPRCYYRCTHKDREGCKATKQVQRISHDEFQTTYFGHHTHSSHNNYNPFNQLEERDLESSSHNYDDGDDDDDGHYNEKTAEAEEESPLAALEETSYCPRQEMSGVIDDDIDYEGCFENLDNLFRSEEMPLLFSDDDKDRSCSNY